MPTKYHETVRCQASCHDKKGKKTAKSRNNGSLLEMHNQMKPKMARGSRPFMILFSYSALPALKMPP